MPSRIKKSNKLYIVLFIAKMYGEDQYYMDSFMPNDDPEHEFLLSQVIASPEKKIDLNLDSTSEYITKRRPAFRETKDDETLDFQFSKSSQRTSSISSEKSVRETFELQMNQLQSALEESMIENTKLKDELAAERGRSRASSTFNLPNQSGAKMTAQTVEVKSGDISFENIVCEQDRNKKYEKEIQLGKIGKAKNVYKTYAKRLNNYFWNFLSDFYVEENEDLGEEQKEETFAPSLLSENIGRLSKAIKPYTRTGESINKVLYWNKRAETLVIFLLYMISAYTGYTIQVLLIFMIWRLSVGYIIVTGLANRFSIFSDEEEEEPKGKDEKNWVDKVAMARVILLKVQSLTGSIADGLEKVNNLMMWRIPMVTKKVYRFLWVLLIASTFIPTSILWRIVGLLIGVKLFLISPAYKKYPRVKDKYDSIGKLWSMLPTNESLNQIQGTNPVGQLPQEIDGEENRNSAQNEAKERHVLMKFGLTTKEKIIDGWVHGKRANLMNRGNLLSGYKSGKLYLTTNYLCFESRAASSNDRLKIELKKIQAVSKAKPFQILPGSGMSIEVFMKEEKSYLFAAIFNRDGSFQDIIETGLSRGHEWAIRHEEI
ncbi:GRAM domain-containing protein 4-like [Oopsacas minuta]|uniref:GRAM domain-containing protein 4-like n=1 Tax=Oopsacas minuta TaxID=111878 RepID=A0AAV7K5U8_9METZ|nr:GRAM domain-containing protein 4-like [Oopsacas minuta]